MATDLIKDKNADLLVNINANINKHKVRPTSNVSSLAIMSVFEHQRLRVQDFAYASDFTWLIAQEFTVFSLLRQRGHWQLKVGHYIGIIILPSNIILEILPKTVEIAPPRQAVDSNGNSSHEQIQQTRQWVEQMFYDLIHTSSFNHKLPATKYLGQFATFLNPLPSKILPLSQWLIEQFLALLAHYRPSQHYQQTVQNQAALQGKLLLKEQLRYNSHQPHKFVSEISALSQATLSNQIIKSALLLIDSLANGSATASTLLGCWRAISPLSCHQLRHLDSYYTNAKQQLSVQPLAKAQLQAAQQLLDLSYWLLSTQQASLPVGHGLNPSPQNVHQADVSKASSSLRLCLLINMNQAFEQWASLRIAANFTQRCTHYQPLYQSQHVWLKDNLGRTTLSMRPDLLIRQTLKSSAIATNTATKNQSVTSDDNAYISHVIDIKWKRLAQACDISASDAYQLTSYAQAYQAKQVWLVYPVTDNMQQPIALHQQLAGCSSAAQNQATLWLMPFNVLTGKLITQHIHYD